MAVEMVFAPPRTGKTWLATYWTLRAMERGRKTVFTNYPVNHPKLGTTHKWSRKMTDEVIVDSFIVIDEAYRDYDYRNKTGFTPNEDFFYGTSGQNGNDIILIAHSPTRVDPKIRDRAEVYHKISKQTLPIISFITWLIWDREIILWFKDDQYLTEEEVSSGEPYSSTTTFYRRSVSKAYDTRYFRTKDPMRTDFERWAPPTIPPKRKLLARLLGWITGIKARAQKARADRNKPELTRAYGEDLAPMDEPNITTDNELIELIAGEKEPPEELRHG